MKIEILEDIAGMKKGIHVEVDSFTGSEMIRLKHAKEVKSEKQENHTRQTKENKEAKDNK